MQRVPLCDSKTTSTPDFPMGWYSVARAHELNAGDVIRVHALDRELVVYRTESGVARVHDAFCPHLGAHLGVNGKVVGEAIQCPFHGWQFGAGGECVKIPYCEDIPSRARVIDWHACETNGEIYLWYHPCNEAPQWQVPTIEELGNEHWTAPRYAEFEVPTHVQDIAENSCDPEHFQYVHLQENTPPSTVTIDDGDGRTIHLRSDMADAAIPGKLHAQMFQPGLAVVRNVYGPGAEMTVYNSSQPIDRNTTLLRWTLCVRNEIADMVGDSAMDGIIAGLQQDYPIWGNKVHRRRPILCKGDESLVLFRKWVRQFYLPDAEETAA
jgi:phenylpropionate dioxygenase-like ring-hydroxylating dioxygenase large terminal subunit